jgi:hypothetical protein
MIHEKLNMAIGHVAKEDLQIAPRRAADSLFGIAEPTLFELASICVGALAQFERANLGLKALSTPT